MAGTFYIGTRRYSSWSLRGWLPVRLAALDVRAEVIPLAGGTTPAIKALVPSGTVPFLHHDGNQVWDSLAIMEYCAEIEPALWPADRKARTRARAMTAEMHSGFRALRSEMPMSLFRRAAGAGRTAASLADVARVSRLWAEALGASGGPFLFGATFGNADAAFAPVVARFLTYRPEMDAVTQAYCDAVRAHPLVTQWYDAAANEPAEWFIPAMESDAA